MTLETCKKRLELAKSDEEKTFWQERIARRLQHRSGKYKHLLEKVKEKAAEKAKPEEKEDGKKPKR